jgi:hypothetical protein
MRLLLQLCHRCAVPQILVERELAGGERWSSFASFRIFAMDTSIVATSSSWLGGVHADFE